MSIPDSTYNFISNKTCPYCQTKIKSSSDFIICSQCGTPHHKECWDENNGCTTYGCRNNPATKEKLNIQGEDVGDLTVEEIKSNLIQKKSDLIKCPNCKNDVESFSVYCKYCGFNLRENKFDKAKEEFEKEYKNKYRRKLSDARKRFLITLFSIAVLLSSLGIISYFTIKKVNEYFSSDEYIIKNFVKSWESNWEDKNIKKLSEIFAEDYLYDGKDRRNVNKEERLRSLEWTFKNYKYIELDLSEIEIIPTADSAGHYTVSFFQKYKSDKFSDTGDKTLKLRPDSDSEHSWEIYREYFE